MKTITVNTYPTFYGENNIPMAFEKGELGFELEIRNETYRNRHILTLEHILDLKKQIDNSVEAYQKFMETRTNYK